MEVPEDILAVLKCSKCENLLSRSPVYLCADGGGLCNMCLPPEPSMPATRNTHYEAVATLLLFPCKNQDEGCQMKVPFNNSEHEEICPQRKFVCPVLGSSACDWSGTAAHILDHCQQQHPDRVLDNPTTFTHNITKFSSHAYLLRAFQLLFLLFTKVCVTSGKIYYSIRYLGSTSEAQTFKYTVNITRGDETIIKKGQVSPQGCLAIQEDSSLILNINYLLGIFGGFNDTTFSVTLERLVVGEKCSKCKFLLTVKDYRDSEGWICEHCAPKKVLCKYFNKGCTCKTYPEKRNQHESFFCNYANCCFNCNTIINDQFLIHCKKEHLMCTNGAVWRASGRKTWRYTLLFEAGTAVCKFDWNNTYFWLSVYTSLSNDQLSTFRCIIKVTQVATGRTLTYNPDLTYNKNCDWVVLVDNKDFYDWSDTFDISVYLKKVK